MDVDEVVVPGEAGEFGVLPGHRPIISVMSPGELRYAEGADVKTLIVWGGIVETRDDKVKVITVNVEDPKDIDRETARKELDAITEKIKGFTGGSEELKSLNRQLKLAEIRVSAGG